jgi:phenylacetaldehyde dehydrogenase
VGGIVRRRDNPGGRSVVRGRDRAVRGCDRGGCRPGGRGGADCVRRRALDGLSPYQRERIINRLADLIEQHIPELAELESIDNGKPKSASQGYDMPKCVQTLRYMAGWATKVIGEHVEPSGFPTGTMHAYVRREPIGVAAQIVPWNFPLMMAVQKIAPAFAAGCTVILKPAEQTSLTALRLADLIAEAGFPAGVFNLVTGLGEVAGNRLVRHPDVDKVAFTDRRRSARSSIAPRPTR